MGKTGRWWSLVKLQLPRLEIVTVTEAKEKIRYGSSQPRRGGNKNES